MKIERIKYPDGQISAKISDIGSMDVIKERINSYEDLFYVRALADAADRSLSIFIPCLFGQRSDRRFSSNQSYDIKLIAEVINNCHFKKIQIFDPHSEKAIDFIHGAERVGPESYVKEVLYDIERSWTHKEENYMVLVAPDTGAYKKVYSMAEEFQLPLVGAMKHRDLQGKIDLKFVGDVAGKECLIVDDLADGGYTFVLLSKALKQQGASRVFLYVSHGYFSKGFGELSMTIDHVWCTNSVKNIESPFVTQFKII